MATFQTEIHCDDVRSSFRRAESYVSSSTKQGGNSENVWRTYVEERRNFSRIFPWEDHYGQSSADRREASSYREGDLIAIKQRTQQGPRLKFAHKYLGPYKIIRVRRNQRFMMQRVDDEEGPQRMLTWADIMDWH